MVYLLETRKPLNEILAKLPLENLVDFQINVSNIKEVKQDKEVDANVSELR